MPSTEILKLFCDAEACGRAAALVTVVSAKGSTPREVGAKMLVYENGTIAGTVGGGKLEALSLREAWRAIKKGENRKAVFELTESGAGMICMGKVELFIEVCRRNFEILILGAGHVGEKIGEAASLCGIPYSVADDRSEFADRNRFPTAKRVLVAKPHLAVRKAEVDDRTCIVIVTRGHALDQECLEKALKTKARYIGMIGSRSKVDTIFKNLGKKGLHPAKDPRVFSPIGLDLGGKAPGEIAVSILAEILKIRYARDGGHMAVRMRKSRRSGK